MSMVTKLVTLVIYWKELPPINSNEPSRRWSFEITRKIKYIISPHAEDPWTPANQGADLL